MRLFERLSPDTLLPMLQTRADELLRAIELTKKSLNHAPQVRLRLARRNNVFYGYHVLDGGKGEYIPKDNLALMSKLAQKDYDEKVLRLLVRMLELVDDFIAKYGAIEVDGIYEDLCKERKSMVVPAQLSDSEFAERWLAVPYKGKGFEAGAPDLRMMNGERVRSKSEVIIADALERSGIPYKYECPRELSDGGQRVYPDFTCLNLRTRKEVLWEHLGMMDNPEYASMAVKKFSSYLKNGFVLGVNLIVSMECSEKPLNQTEVRKIIQGIFKVDKK